jgi:Tol biopolymer transport system component
MRRLYLLFALFPFVALATPKETIDLLFAVKAIDQAALAPDGRRLAWVEREQKPDRTESRNKFLHLIDGDTTRRVTAGKGEPREEKHASWSHDGAQLAFLSDAEKAKQLQLYVVPAAGGAPRQLTKLSGQLARPQWSPDGRTLALLFIEGQTQLAGAVEAAARDSGEVEEKIFEHATRARSRKRFSSSACCWST